MNSGRDTQADGYRAPIHLVLTRVLMIGGVPRELLAILAMFCFGAMLYWKSWGPIPIYVAGHAWLAWKSWRDPWWHQILRERVHLFFKHLGWRVKGGRW